MANVFLRNLLNQPIDMGIIKAYLDLTMQKQQCTVKLVLNGQTKKYHKMVFKTNYQLMHCKGIAECSKGRAFCNTF